MRQSLCLRRLGGGSRAREVGFGRFLANDKVTVERLIEGWSVPTLAASADRHVLAIQDTSEIAFKTTPERRRGLGEIGKGNRRGVLVHAMLAVDADTGSCLGLAGGSVTTRDKGRVSVPHAARALADKESRRWIDTPLAAKTLLARAEHITVVADRESDIYGEWALVPDARVDVLTRLKSDRRIAAGGTLIALAARLPVVASRAIDLAATPKRPARRAQLDLRFTEVEILRPRTPDAAGLVPSIALRFVEVTERTPPPGAEPICWRLLTTHAVRDVTEAWQIVDWYRRRWTIEQLFRLMKSHGLRLEDSQLADASGLIKLAAIATRAAAIILQLVQARDGGTASGAGDEPAAIAFTEPEMAVLERLEIRFAPRTDRQKNTHKTRSLAWAAWIIARLGGWNGYASAKPPGPITFRHGLQYFQTIVEGWRLRDV